MCLSAKEILQQRLMDRGIEIEKSFKNSVIDVENGGLISFAEIKNKEEGSKYVLTLPRFTEDNDIQQSIQFAWALANYNVLKEKREKPEWKTFFWPVGSNAYRKRVWKETERICIQEGFMDAVPTFRESLNEFWRFITFRSGNEEIAAIEKWKFRWEFNRRKTYYLSDIKSFPEKVLEEIGRLVVFIVTVGASYLGSRFLFLALAAMDKVGFAIPGTEGFGTLPRLEVLQQAHTFWLFFVSMFIIYKIMKRSYRW
ncbi:hypothetical protein P4U05_18425 [Bacillus paranthracis]|uniref:hypothetical protein n=1 Tax=Bacillus cereus group TaxID=86661 RepID=UPI000200F528|nr:MULTISPECIES: hypothetical protein [Bacillus cereus group]ADY24931.1 hypothetical protein YBT020_28886 [Bacillus thuringiensis serovar finitimus YBT-020]MRC74517.1 hypothetical protein [Bacillus thuringiensis]OTX77257.1 hypothetical protein BK722_02325 [Bacillus thuringiensis serovar finitimus]MEC3360851.1 hypothetical protein [Bacillus paranthracis]MED0786440.1 hypothetical protein [Bacillus paranthracis]